MYYVSSTDYLSKRKMYCYPLKEFKDFKNILIQDLTIEKNLDWILIACYYAGYFSLEYMTDLFDLDKDEQKTVQTTFSKMCSGSNLIRADTLKAYEGYTRTFYTLTRKGVKYVQGLLPGPEVQDYYWKKTRKGDRVNLHGYCTAYNMLSLFAVPDMFFRAVMECPRAPYRAWIDSDMYVKPDLTAAFRRKGDFEKNSGEEERGMIFIEQDMGTESVSVLVTKIYKYIRNGNLMKDDDNALIFSCKRSMSRVWREKSSGGDLSGVPQYVSRLITFMEKCHVESTEEIWDDCQTYYLFREKAVHRDTRNRIQTGGNSDPMDAELYGLIRRVTDDIHLATGFLVKKDGEKVRGVHPALTLDELRRYHQDLLKHSNPYVNRPYYEKQFRSCARRRDNTLSGIYQIAYDDAYGDKFRWNIKNGMQIFFVPTDLIVNAFPFLFPQTMGLFTRAAKMLEAVFPGLTEEVIRTEYRNIVGRYSMEDNTFRHVFTLENGDTVAFEFVSYDIGARYRCGSFYQGIVKKQEDEMPAKRNPGQTFHHVVCFTAGNLNDFREAREFAAEIDYHSKETEICFERNSLHLMTDDAFFFGGSYLRALAERPWCYSPVLAFENPKDDGGLVRRIVKPDAK